MAKVRVAGIQNVQRAILEDLQVRTGHNGALYRAASGRNLLLVACSLVLEGSAKSVADIAYPSAEMMRRRSLSTLGLVRQCRAGGRHLLLLLLLSRG